MRILALIFLLSFNAKAQDTVKLKFAYVEWEDICSTDSGWHETSEAIEWKDSRNSIVTQVGFILHRDEKYLVLIDSYFNDGTVGTVIRIPIGVVKYLKIVELTFLK